MTEIVPKLHQYSFYIPPMDFTIHQYLLATNPAILFAAGTVQQAEAALPQVKEALGGRGLKYVFVSHMESDEAGGLPVWRTAYPDLKVVCGNLAARELPGWGYDGEVVAVSGGDELADGDLSLSFVDYPSEVHLQDGLVCLERNSGILYSANLFLRFGNGAGQTVEAKWEDEVAAIDEERVPGAGACAKLKADLMELAPRFVAVGHGFCLKCE